MNPTGPPHPFPAGPPRANDGAWWFVPSMLATMAGLLALPVDLLFALFSFMPADSCDPGSCGGGINGTTIFLIGAAITSLACGILCWVIRRPSQRWVRMLLASGAVAAAVFPPLIYLGSAGSG
jgi:hypothetical protein